MASEQKGAVLSARAQKLFRLLVERYISDGQPVGSRTLARGGELDLSPATIRNVMADLEDMGLIRAPHTSAGRVPTTRGFRLFVSSLLRCRELSVREVERVCQGLSTPDGVQRLLEKTSTMLAERLCLVAGREDDSHAHEDGPAAQPLFVPLFDRGEERIQVGMEDRCLS